MDYTGEIGQEIAQTTDDMALVQEFRQGNDAAFDSLYHRYATFVYNVCLGVLGHPDDARDAMQETFIQLFRSLPRFRGHSHFSTWIYRIAVNKCLDAARRRRPVESSTDLSHLPVDGGRQDDNPYEDRVRMTMLQLKSDYRIVLVLHYFQSLSYQEIAQTLHCSLDQVRVRIHRAKRAFRLVWGKEGGPYDL